MWSTSNKGVRRMIETLYLSTIIYILFYALIGITIIALAAIIMITMYFSKRKD